MYYTIQSTLKDILHYGKGHDDSPPGRGSGRYAWGSGKTDAKRIRKGEKKALRTGRKIYKDVYNTTSMVFDDSTGEYIAVSKKDLKRHGKEYAIAQARDPKVVEASRKKELAYLDKMFKDYLNAGVDEKTAYEEAGKTFMEVTGYTKKSMDNIRRIRNGIHN